MDGVKEVGGPRALRIVGLVFGVFALARPWGRRVAVACGLTSLVIVLPPIGLTALAWNGAGAAPSRSTSNHASGRDDGSAAGSGAGTCPHPQEESTRTTA